MTNFWISLSVCLNKDRKIEEAAVSLVIAKL
jgi:hypothetical protein